MFKTKTQVGAERSFEAIYRDNYNLIRHVLRRFPALESQAEDLVHDVFLIFFRHMHQIPEGKARGWLVVTARNLAIDHLRKFKRHETELRDFSDYEVAEGLWVSDPLHETLVQKMGELLEQLPPGANAVSFRRYYRDGASLKEIASENAEAIGTVAARLYRWREKLRPQFQMALESMV